MTAARKEREAKPQPPRHQVRKPANIVYGVDDTPPAWLIGLMAVQHVFIQFVGLTFAVLLARTANLGPVEAQSFVCLSMIAGGIATILQTLKKGPIGAGYLTPEGPDPSFLPASLQAVGVGGIGLLCGMTVVAGLFECFLSQVIYKLRALFPPEVTGLIVAMVGVSVIPASVESFLGINMNLPQPEINPIITTLSVVVLLVIVGANVWGKGPVRQFSLPLGIVVGYAAAGGLGLFSAGDLQQLHEAPLLRFPHLSLMHWGFQPSLLLTFMIAITCSTLKNVGDITTCQKVNDANWRRADMGSIRGGILADGLGTILGGLMGGMGQASYSANVGLSIASGVTSRIVGVATGGLLIVLAFLPKLAAVFLMMPASVMGAALVFSVSFMILSGIQIMTSRMIDARKTFVTGISLIFGISVFALLPLYERVTPALQPIFTSSLSLATVLVVLLNVLLRLGVGKSATLELAGKEEPVAAMRDFLEAQGGRWGARPEVVQRAIAALNEILEAVTGEGLAESGLKVTASFDELNLDVGVQYQGRPLEYPAVAPTQQQILSSPEGLTSLAGYLARRLADRLTAQCKDGACQVALHFDH